MLFLLFQIGSDRYALEARHAIEVIPLVAFKQIPQAPRGVAGVFNYRGRPVPAVDLCEITCGRPARERLSTRIIVVNFTPPREMTFASSLLPTGHDIFRGEPHEKPPGLGAITSPPTISRGESARRAGVSAPEARPPQWLGLVAERATGMLRREEGQFVASGVQVEHAPYLGPVTMDAQGVIQLLHPQHLLTDHARQLLNVETQALAHESR